MAYLLALDQGTTSSRAIIFAQDGHTAGFAQQEFEQHFPQPGWVEHDAMEIWRTQLAVASSAIQKADITAKDVAAIGITNQRETTVLWDRKTGAPVHKAIVWQDRRTAGFCDDLVRRSHDELIQKKTGLVIDAYFSASKLRWLLDNVKGARERAQRGELAFGTIDSWLLWNLTAGSGKPIHATDVSNASRTMLFNILTGTWDDELLELFNVPRSVLPQVVATSQVVGQSSASLLGDSIPIAAMAGDQQAALFGQACFERGLAKNTYGTGCFMLMNTGEAAVTSRHKLLSTVAWKLGNSPTTYALEGSVFIGGAVVQWLRDGLGIIKSAAEIEPLAASVPDSHGLFVVPAFAGLGAPHWDQYARGSISGITRGTTKAHFARAALESIAFQVADVLEIMQKDSGAPIKELRVDGGAAQNNLLLQFQADLLGVPVIRPRVTETTALGAAYLAGLATGVYGSIDEIGRQWTVERTFQPQMSRDEVASRRKSWQKALGRALDWEDHA